MLSDTPEQPQRPITPTSERENVETELWQSFKSGDQASFALIYQKFFPCLYSYGLKIGAEQDIVKDTIQDLFVYLWKHRTNLADTNSIKYYLWTALRRRIVQATNALPGTSVSDNIMTEFENSAEATIITEEISTERKEHLLAAMRSLTKRQREAVSLKFYHNLKNEEIAQRMSIKVEAVYNLISKSLVVLKKSYHRVSTLVLLLNYFFSF